MSTQPEEPDDTPPPGADAGPAPPALFQSIVADADEGVAVLGPDGLVSYANPAAEFLLGHGREELTGEMFGFPRADADQPTTVNVISRDGCVRIVDLRVEPLPAGPPGTLLLRLRDVTNYHRDVATAREQVRRRDEFLAMLSHEVRNPLAAIRTASQLLARDGVADDARRAAGDICDRQFKHLERILDDLLDVARISRGRLEIVRGPVELGRVVRDALDEAAPLVARRGHRLRVDLPAEPIWVDGDATRLEQVVVNLVNNAAKFTPPNGDVAVSLSTGPDGAEICVRDNGPGVPADLLPHVFEPFVQGAQSAARTEGGLGIGLALVHTIVLRHGGTACVEPNPDGPGVTFTVNLPVAASGPAPSPPDRLAGPGRPLRVLLVEDADDARRMLKQILELDGHEVFEAGDGPAGLAALLDRPPDVALVDIGLPGLDGLELARRARRDQRAGRVRLIAVTGYGMPNDVAEARRAGFDGHVVKPVRYPDLCRLLHADGPGCPDGDGEI